MQRAKDTLLKNLYQVKLNGQNYQRTVPSKEFYVHQWNWDSATHAMGLVYFDERRAVDELLSLISGQWKNGLIAQITFNPNEEKYFPGPEFWGTEKFATGEILTSGITQPPLLGISLLHLYQTIKDIDLKKELVIKVLPAVIKYHEFLKNFRDPEDSGLLTVVHPWESGTDNSTRWDEPLANISLEDIPDAVKILVNKYRSDDKLGNSKHRPGLTDYYKYMYLVHLFSKWGWDNNKIVKESPFVVKDVLFNSLWCRANFALAELLEQEGRRDESATFLKMAQKTQKSLLDLWDDKSGLYTDLDVSNGKRIRIKENTVATFLPIWAGAYNKSILDSLIDRLKDPKQYWSAFPVPTTSLNNSKFELTRYWRGPTWPITNLFVIEGLGKLGPEYQALKMELLSRTFKMIEDNGFYEYFDPINGGARPDKRNTLSLGFGSFSWTSAIYIYLSNKYKET